MMDNKITWQDLAADLATKAGLQRKEAEAFVRTFFDTLGKCIQQEKSVKIKALGTFKMVDVQDRESVNVNTGERIVISGHSKIGFLPDNALKELVNKPFADFQTVILNEGTSLEEIEKVNEKYSLTGTEEEAEEEAPAIMIPAEDEQNNSASEETTEINDVGNNAAETAAADMTQTDDTANGTNNEEDARQEQENAIVADDTTAEEAQEEVIVQQKEVASAQEVEAEDASETEQSEGEQIVDEQAKVEQAEAEETAQTTVPQPATIVMQPQPTIQHTVQGHNIWRTSFLTLIVILLMFACYIAGYLRVINMSWLCLPPAGSDTELPAETIQSEQTQPKPDTAKTTSEADREKAETTPQATTAGLQAGQGNKDNHKVVQEKSAPQDAKATTVASTTQPSPTSKTDDKTDKKTDKKKAMQDAQKYAQVSGGKYLITGIRKTRTMQRGDNLYRMARQEYGDKSAVEYIKALNQFPNPDNIPVGYEVKLPELTEKGN